MIGGSLVFGRYRLHEQVGVGGMGVVWRATDELLHQQIALKRVALAGMTDADAQLTRERTLREARVAAQLRGHPHVVALYDVEVDEENAWLVLEYLPSRSLGEILRAAGPLEHGEVARIGADIADALATAHSRGVLHRDITPGNVLISRDGAVKLTDFGISHLVGDPKLTQAGTVSGTLAYLAPEVATSGESSPASDVFSLGATLYTALEGDPPFGSTPNTIKQLNNVRAGVIRPPTKAGPLTPLLLRLLAADPAGRPDPAAARDELAGYATGLSRATAYLPVPDQVTASAQGPGSAHGYSLPPRSVRSARRSNGGWAAVLAAASLAVVAILLITLLPGRTVDGSAAPAPRTGPPTSSGAGPVPTGLPESVGTVTMNGDASTVDPCPLIDPLALRQFGEVGVGRGPGLASCQARLGTPGSGDVRLDLSYSTPVADISSLGGKQQNLGGITVVRVATVTEGPITFCRSVLVLSDNTAIYVNAYQRSGPPVDLCEVTETATNVAVHTLATEGVAFTKDSASAFTLTRADACASVRPATLRRVPGIDPSRSGPGFGNWSCFWGPAVSGRPRVTVHFQLDTLDNLNDYGRSTKVAGRTAYQREETGQYNANRCTIYVIHKQGSGDGDRTEVMSVVVDSPSSTPVSCRQAKDIAAGIEANLS